MKLKFFCRNPRDTIGVIGESPEAAFELYKINLDKNASIGDLIFFNVCPDEFQCKIHITMSKTNG